MEIVRLHAGFCAAADLIPVPVLDSVVVSGLQFQMVEALAAHYGVPFDRERSQAILTALGTGFAHEVLTRTPTSRWLGGLIRRVPVIGAPLRAVAWPGALAAWTYALGKSYVDHYEAGGQFSDFEPAGILRSPVASVLV